MKRGEHQHSHWTNAVKSYYYGLTTGLGNRKKVDELNEDTLHRVRKGMPLTILFWAPLNQKKQSF